MKVRQKQARKKAQSKKFRKESIIKMMPLILKITVGLSALMCVVVLLYILLEPVIIKNSFVSTNIANNGDVATWRLIETILAAGGSIGILSFKIKAGLILFSGLLLYVSMVLLSLNKAGMPYKTILTKSYWTEFKKTVFVEAPVAKRRSVLNSDKKQKINLNKIISEKSKKI